jgi:adenylylsulfate kinase
MKRILIMGLPGSGKTTLAKELYTHYLNNVTWLNADLIRQEYNDWDFSESGRLRQAQRMRNLADCAKTQWVIADFVAPLPEMRHTYAADFVVWVDTIRTGRYEDTNRIFVPPDIYDIRVTEKDSKSWAEIVYKKLVERQNHEVWLKLSLGV